jgi:hypothetical protein
VSFQDKATLVSESGNGEDKKTATTNALDITRVSWSQEEKRCLFCAGTGDGEEGDLLRCSRCKKVRFCDRQCQIQAWKTHKKSCKAELLSTQPIAKKSKIAK